jgi:outer membrane assembly lipoprotein YfgL
MARPDMQLARPGSALRRRGLALALAGALIGAGCSSDKPKPTALENITPTLAGRQVWSTDIGSVRFPMRPVVRDDSFFVAADNGTVMALRADSGSTIWRTDIGARIAAGVGSDGRFVSVVTRGNEVVTLDSGREVWRKSVPSSVVTPPLVAGERVFVMSVDRAVHAFDAQDGRRLWVFQRPGDALTLAQASVVTAYKDNLLVAQGARLTALDPMKGTVRWDAALATPRGTNEVERLADLLGPVVRLGDRVCARAFQSSVGCADAARGATLWSRNVGGIHAIGGDAERLYGADAVDRITAWRSDNGDVAWTSEKLLYRGLSAPLAIGTVVVFGDAQGYVHFLNAATGEQQLRLPTDGGAIVGVPVASGQTLLVTTNKGGLYAFRPN